MLDDLFADATDQEREKLHMILRRMRIDEAKGHLWHSIWPDLGGTFALPLPLPCGGENGRARCPSSPEVVVSDVQANGRPRTPPPATRLQQLEHNDNEDAENDDPDSPLNGDTELDKEILEVLQNADKPLKRATIAKRLNRENGTQIYERLRRLREGGRVKLIDNSLYWLACRTPIPTA